MNKEGINNEQHLLVLGPALQVHWSQRRGWHGDEVVLCVRSEGAKNDLDVDLKILGGADAKEIDKASGKCASSKLDHKYTINWKDKPYAKNREFQAKASAGPKLSADSPTKLAVDLEPPIFSA